MYKKWKIIFLDIDGVLNVIEQGYDDYGPIFHKHFEENLKWIIENTGSKIVISSSWRTDGIEKLRNMWIDRNLSGDIIDITPQCYELVDSGKFEFYDEVKRGHEIQDWIDRNQDYIETYCIIDDDNDFLENQLANFVRTANNIEHEDCIDIGYGLTRKCSEKVIKILNKKKLKFKKFFIYL